jgi:hypothetical protein
MRVIRNSAAARILQFTFCLGFSPLLAAQQVSQLSSSDAVKSVSPVEIPLEASGPMSILGATQVPLVLDQPVSSATAYKGDRIRFKLVNNLSVNSKLVVPAGTAFYATVTHVRPKTANRSGDLKFSNPELDLGNGQRFRLTKNDPQESLGAGAIPVLIVGVVTIGPLVVVTSPIWLTKLAIDKIHGRQFRALAQEPKPETVDKEFSEGEEFNYYADRHALTRQKRSLTSPPHPADDGG